MCDKFAIFCTSPVPFVRKAFLYLLLGIVGASDASAFLFFRGVKWREVPPDQMAMTEPRLDPEAGSEILISEISVDDRNDNTVYSYYYRYKIFSERGLEAGRTFKVEYDRNDRIRNLAARVIRPDGSIVEVESADVFDQEVVRWRGSRIMVKSFSLPSVEVGCIVEVQWQKTVSGLANGLRFSLQREYPAHHLLVRIAPYGEFNSTMLFGNHMVAAALGRDVQPTIQNGRDGFNFVELRDIPAYKNLPYAPPRDSVEPWVRLNYYPAGRGKLTDDEFWQQRAKMLYETRRDDIQGKNRHIRKRSNELLAGVSGHEARLRVLYNFVQSEITNLSFRGHGYTEDELEKLKDNDHSVHTLERGYGYIWQINDLFASLAAAAGFEVRYAVCNDRSEMFFSRDLRFYAALPKWMIAIRNEEGEGTWEFFDPGDRDLPYGTLNWYHVGSVALIDDPRELNFVVTPVHYMGKNSIKRSAQLSLSADGTLTGTVETTYSGQEAVDLRYSYRDRTQTYITDKVADAVHARLSRAIVRNVKAHDLEKPEADARITYEIEVPGYAQVVGGRMFFKPSYFTNGREPEFKEEQRDLAIYFAHENEEAHWVHIDLPEGFELDAPAAPHSAGDHIFAEHQTGISVRKAGRTITLRRSVAVKTWHLEGKYYPLVKSFYDFLNVQDNHMLALKKVEKSTEETASESAGEEVAVLQKE